jgi:hypothetical protein
MTGLADNVIALQSTKEPFGRELLSPLATTVTFDGAMSEPDLQQFANVVAKSSGLSPLVATALMNWRTVLEP